MAAAFLPHAFADTFASSVPCGVRKEKLPTASPSRALTTEVSVKIAVSRWAR
jgi:hypothetical protein